MFPPTRPPFVLRLAGALLAALLGACAASPGGSGSQGATTLSSAAGPDTASGAGNPPVLTPITADLLRRQDAERGERDGAGLEPLLSSRAGPYRLATGDILSIFVWGHGDLAGDRGTGIESRTAALPGQDAALPSGYLVDERGTITYPFVGAVQVAGMTVEEARQALADRLQRYIRKPSLVMRVQAFRSKRVYVDGALKAPGLLTIDDIPMSLVEALNRAGGLLPDADRSRIRLSRAGVTHVIDLPALIRRGQDPNSLLLAPGDVVRVPTRDESQVFVSGEVNAPRPVPMHDGRLSLSEALGSSGGVNPQSGDRRQVYVIRKADPAPRVFLLDAREPGAYAMAEAFQLEPKDVVFVAATPLTQWHRTISSLLPGSLSSAVGAVGQRQ